MSAKKKRKEVVQFFLIFVFFPPDEHENHKNIVLIPTQLEKKVVLPLPTVLHKLINEIIMNLESFTRRFHFISLTFIFLAQYFY